MTKQDEKAKQEVRIKYSNGWKSRIREAFPEFDLEKQLERGENIAADVKAAEKLTNHQVYVMGAVQRMFDIAQREAERQPAHV